MAPDTTSLLARIDQLLATQLSEGQLSQAYAAVVEAMHGTLTVATIVYGSEDVPQVQTLLKSAQRARDQKFGIEWAFYENVWPTVQGMLRAMRTEIATGLVGTIERRAAGEVIADMLGLAKEALAQRSDGAKNVAAVLTAAAYEDTIRRMGATLAHVADRPPLEDVIGALKKVGVLAGASVSTATSYLKFRNDALHADWTKLDASVVASCLTFVEQLTVKHFS